MSLRTTIAPLVTRLLTNPHMRNARRRVSEWRRRLSGEQHEVHYFHQIDDPYSHLMLQVLAAFQTSYNVTVRMHLVAPPSDDVAPEREALENFSRRDAADIAPYHGLKFTDPGFQPTEICYEQALRAMAASSDLINAALPISESYWRNDSNALKNLAMVSRAEAEEKRVTGTKLRDKYGHYLGGMLFYGGEWYWGVDRMPYLEERLRKLKLRHVGCKQITQFQARPTFMIQPARRRLTVEFFPSARSPYTYLAMHEIYKMAEEYPIDIVTRPVLPMVMRNLPVPPRKGKYIIMDTKREADRIGVPFGRINDPVGTPVRRCYSLFPYAASEGKEGAFLTAFCQMAWSEGIDMGTGANLRKAIERAGLDWEAAQAHLDQDNWQDIVEANRLQLVAAGLWGVPSFRLLDANGDPFYDVWGRDRIWLLAHKIQEALVA